MRHLLTLASWVALCVVSSGCRVNNGPVVTSSCNDFIRNGDETDIDCGGSRCPRCGDGRVCAVAADCASGECSTSGHCQEGAFTVPTLVYDVLGDAGSLVSPGVRAGFAISSARGGSSFRLLWTGDGNVSGTYHEFYGSVYTDGTFVSVTACTDPSCASVAGDYISGPYTVPGGERVDFDSANVNGLDGMDFVVNGGQSGIGEPVFFDLFIDGAYVPSAIVFTEASTGQPLSPSSIPFGLQTR